jgi:hypothetical protein
MKRISSKINYYLGLFVILFLPVLQMGCKSYAYVTCNNVEKFQSRSGVINVPDFSLGDIIMLDTVKKNGQYVFHCQPSNISTTQPRDSFEILTSTGFSIGLQGKVAKAEAEVQADVKSNISNITNLFLTNRYRKNIIDPSMVINEKKALLTLKNILQNNRNVICMLISGMIYADKLEFRVKKERAIGANANLVKVGDFKVEVTYNCEGNLGINGKDGGVFFKSNFFKLNLKQDQLVVYSVDIDLSKYNLVPTILP